MKDGEIVGTRRVSTISFYP